MSVAMSSKNLTLRNTIWVCTFLLLAACSRGEDVGASVRHAYAQGQFVVAEIRIDRGLEEGTLSEAGARSLRAELPQWKDAHGYAERTIIATIQSLGERAAYAELRNLIDRLDGQRIRQQVLFEQVQSRYRYWVKEAARRPEIQPDRPIQVPGPGGPSSVVPRVSEGSEDVFGAAAYRNLEIDVERLVSGRNYTEALKVLREQLPVAGSRADAMREQLWRVEDRAKEDLDAILERIENLEGAGKLEDAMLLARAEKDHFPYVGRFAKLRHVEDDLLRRIEHAKVAGIPEWITERPGRDGGAGKGTGERDPGGERKPTPSLETREGRVAAAIRAGDERRYAEAASLFEGLAVELEDANPRLHAIYRTEADEARLLGYAKESVSRALKRPESAKDLTGLPAGRGRKGKLLAADEEKLSFEFVTGEEEVRWSTLSDQEFTEIVDATSRTPLEKLGVAILRFRLGDTEGAEKQLYFSYRRDRSTKPLVDRILARARGEDPGSEGYVLDGREFILYAVKMRRLLEKKVATLVSKTLRQRDDEKRDSVFAQVTAEGDVAIQLAKERLSEERKELLAEIEQAPIRGSMKKLITLRRELDKRRKHALELIFDTKKYFYPYKPPAVSGAKAKEYAEVQAEVDRRVAAVRDIWNGKGISVAVSGSLQKKLATLGWIQKRLDELGVRVEGNADIDQLVRGKGVSIRSVSVDSRDERYMSYWAETDEFNEKKLEEWVRDNKVSRAQADVVRHTNAYREMMGRHPLRVDLRVMRAAQAHTDEMSTMGYFSHYSPTQGRRTPQERMKLEGYPNPGGENLAINSGAEAAVSAWKRSSGHHRNMLSKGHGDLGTGASGRYFAQNFGGGLGRWR